jgi:hypothetical protein
MIDTPFTKSEAAEIAAECVAALDWQTVHLIAAMDTDAVTLDDFMSATTPKHPATVRLIEAMKEQSPVFSAMTAIVSRPAESIEVRLMATTCNSIAHNLADWGFHREAEMILAALMRHDQAATEH